MGNAGSFEVVANLNKSSVSCPSVLCLPEFFLTLRRTNAIKFTKDQPVRRITVKLGMSDERPPQGWQSILFSTDERPKSDIFSQPGWGDGKRAYIWIKVMDTGCGMTEDEQKDLFTRFKQATPRYETAMKQLQASLTLTL